jgi:CVNH domain
MSIRRAMSRVLARGAATMLLTGCVLPLSDSDGPSPATPYQGGSGYDAPYGSLDGSSIGRPEYRGTLPSGTYTETCRGMDVDRDRHRLEAECRQRDGRWHVSRLDLRECDRGIVNNNGWLQCQLPQQTLRLPAGSYRESCRDFSVEKNHLGARCRRKNGNWQDTELDLARCKGPIRNDDGRLVCG